MSKTYDGDAIEFTGSSNDNAAIIENSPWHSGTAVSINNTGNIVAIGSSYGNGEAGLVSLYKNVTSITYSATAVDNMFALDSHGLFGQ